MNCLYITLFFNIVAGIVQTFIKSWNQLLYSWVTEVCRQTEAIRDQRLPTAPLFVVNISPSFGEFTAPLRHILLIHNVTVNSNNLFVNFRWTFTFCIEKSYDGTHLAYGRTLDRRCNFKRVSLKQSRFYHSQTSTTHR
jgi:hypothetical protein